MAEKKEKKSAKKSSKKAAEEAPKTSEKRATKRYDLVYKCGKTQTPVRVFDVSSKFECPACKSKMTYKHAGMTLTSIPHVDHELRRITERGKKK